MTRKLSFIIFLILVIQLISVNASNSELSTNNSLKTSSSLIVSPNDLNGNSSGHGQLVNAVNGIYDPAIFNGFNRNGTSFNQAIDLKENESLSGQILNPYSSKYFRYYAQYPYEYVNVTAISNSTELKLSFYDQFFTSILNVTGNTGFASFSIPSSQSPYKENIRFIGWYYINITSYFTPVNFSISFHYVLGDGSSLWSPIQIKPGSIAWNGIFKDMENSGSQSQRDSTFYSFYVNKSDPQISLSISPINAYISLYDPNWTFLYNGYGQINWLTTQQGFYFVEILGSSLLNTNLTISLALQPVSMKIGDSFDQPLEISRSTGLTDNLTARPKFLKLYLFIGENVSINIGNNLGNNYSITVYGPWGLSWLSAQTNINTKPFNLFNVENTGYYIFLISGPIGSYSVKLHFEYKITEGVSWESAKSVNLNSSYSDQHYLFTINAYYYRINFQAGSNLKITFQGTNIADAYILGKYRQIIGYINGSKVNSEVLLKNINDTNFIFIQINPSSSQSNFTMNIQKIAPNFTYSYHIDGTLLSNDTFRNIIEFLPLIKLYLKQNSSTGLKILAESSTDEFGFFSITGNSQLPESDPNFQLMLTIEFMGPALQLLKYSPFGNNYDLTLDLNTTNLPNVHLDNFLIPISFSWSYKIAHIFLTVTKGWLFALGLDQTHIGPPQIHVYYSSDSIGSFYSPYDPYHSSPTKYVIYLLGYTQSDDDGWDDTVILHEYGHHVEQTYSITNNPGGSHFYDSVISPDLAHGEGFPTFFAATVLNTSIYRDTNVAGYSGISLETGRISSTTSLNNTLEDLFGPYGETSVFTLYYELLNANIGVTLDGLFNIFFNYRQEHGLGVTNTNEVYTALIQEYPSLIDNISKAYYDHGNGFFAYPFIQSGSDKIISSSDVNANFTWKLFDSNPKSYQILLNSTILKTGIWNFTEEVIVLNLYQFNFLPGTTQYFTLKLNDTLDNQRVYTFMVKIISSYTSEGRNFVDSINISPNTPISTIQTSTTYYQYIPNKNGVINLIYTASTYNLMIYDQNTSLIQNVSQFNSQHSIFLEVPKEKLLYFVFTNNTMTGIIKLIVNDNPLGYSETNPIIISTSNSVLAISENVSTTYYTLFKTSYDLRLLHLSIDSNTIISVSIYYPNCTLVTNFTLNSNLTNISYELPINKFISDVDPYNPFSTFLIVFSSNLHNIQFNTSIQPSQNSEILLESPSTMLKNTTQTIIFSYSGINRFSYTLLINNQSHGQGSFENISSTNFTFSIPINDLQIGLYVIDMKIVDGNGLINYYQFVFSIITKPVSTNSTTSKTTGSINNGFPEATVIFISILIAVLSAGIIMTYFERNQVKKYSSKLFKRLKNKKTNE